MEIELHLAAHPRAMACTLAKLAKSEHVEVRCAVGDNANTTRDVLAVLVNDENPDVRYALAENHNIPIDILKQLAQDENPYVASRAIKTIERLSQQVACTTTVTFAYAC